MIIRIFVLKKYDPTGGDDPSGRFMPLQPVRQKRLRPSKKAWRAARRHSPIETPTAVLNQLQAQRSPYDFCGALQGRDRHIAVLRIKKAGDLAAARPHAFGQALARQVLRLHRLRDPPISISVHLGNLQL